MFSLDQAMQSLSQSEIRSVQVWGILSYVSICCSALVSETDWAKISFVSETSQAMEWVSVSSSDVCDLASATARKLF